MQAACRLLDVAESGYHHWRSRPPYQRSIRHLWLLDQIRAVNTASRGTYGAHRVHAEPTLGLGISVGHGQVELLMARAGIKGLLGNRRLKPKHQTRPREIWSTGRSRDRSQISCGSTTLSAVRHCSTEWRWKTCTIRPSQRPDEAGGQPDRLVVGNVDAQPLGDLFGTPRLHPCTIGAMRLVAAGPRLRLRALDRFPALVGD